MPLLQLVNSNFVTEPPRPTGPITKYTGPILPSPAKPLPAELDEWIRGAGPMGTVYMSFGGTLAAPLPASRTVLRAVEQLPGVNFIWKLTEAEQAALEGDLRAAGLTNLRVVSWVPQNDLLGHPGVTAFVTQVSGRWVGGRVGRGALIDGLGWDGDQYVDSIH